MKSPRNPKAPKINGKARIFDTLGQAASVLGLSLTLLKRAKLAGCSAFRHGRVHEKDLLPWLDAHRDELQSGDPRTLEEVRIAEGLEKIRERRRRNEREDGKLVSRHEVQEGLSKGMAILFGELDRIFCSEMPARAKGRTEIEIRDMHQTAIERLREGLKERLAAL